jgi:hypothetical protein
MFWQHYGWQGVAALISLLVLAAFGVATLLFRLPAAE